MRQYLICRLKPESHRDQLKRALSIPVLCVLITRVRKTDGLTEKVIRWGYHCPTPSLFSFFCSLFQSFLLLRGGARGWIDHLSWLEISNPWADNGWHGWISISSGRHANVCAPGSISGWRSCEGSAFSPAIPLPPRGFPSLTSSLCVSRSLYLFLYVDTGVKPPLVLLLKRWERQ